MYKTFMMEVRDEMIEMRKAGREFLDICEEIAEKYDLEQELVERLYDYLDGANDDFYFYDEH